MEKKGLSNCHIPEELCREILLRLPAKSLVRFRCVSKSWLSLISDSEFCRVHLQTFKNNRDETHLLTVKGNYLDCDVRCSDTYATRARTFIIFPPRFRTGVWRVECSIDGLVLLKDRRTNNLVVWNPSIRKFHDIPRSPTFVSPPKSFFFDINLGLGYDPLVKDYKLVKLIFGRQHALQSIEMYTLGGNSWKVIQYHGKESSDWHWELVRVSKVIYLRGCFYFIGINLNNDVPEMVYFDLSDEAFGFISLPPAFSKPVLLGESPLLFGYGTSSLALCYLRMHTITWAVLESESFTVTKFCSHEMFWTMALFLKKNLDMLLWSHEGMSFGPATDEGLEEQCCMVSSHNLETGEGRMLFVEMQGHHEFVFRGVYGYVESLVLL